MTIVLTSDGATHITQLNDGVPAPTNMFDGLVFSQGNDGPQISDSFDEMSDVLGELVLSVASGYPKKGDDDVRNTSRDPEAWTWKFVREAGEPFVASNFAICNYSGGVIASGSPLAVHGRETSAQRFDERRIWFINVLGGDVRLVQVTETSTLNRIQRVAGFSAKVRATASAPGGSVITPSAVRTRANSGASVFTAADVISASGYRVTPGDVVSLDLFVEKFVSADQSYELIQKRNLDCYHHVFGTEQLNDPRWPHAGGYNVSYLWSQPRNTREATFRLRFRMELCDDDFREWSNVIEVRPW